MRLEPRGSGREGMGGVLEGGGLMREVVLSQKALYLVIKILVLDLKKNKELEF